MNFFLRSSDRTAGQNLDDFLRAAAAHRQIRRAGALPFQPPQRPFDDAVFERMKRDDRDARPWFEDFDGIVANALMPGASRVYVAKSVPRPAAI